MKKLMIKAGTYTTRDGEVKNNWKQIGIIKSNDNGEFALLDPTVNLAGFDRHGKDMLMVSIFSDDRKPAQKSQVTSQEPDFDDDIPFN